MPNDNDFLCAFVQKEFIFPSFFGSPILGMPRIKWEMVMAGALIQLKTIPERKAL